MVAGQNAKEDVKSEALDILSDCITRFGPQLAPLHGSLKDALLPQVKTKLKHAGFRRLGRGLAPLHGSLKDALLPQVKTQTRRVPSARGGSSAAARLPQGRTAAAGENYNTPGSVG